MINDMMRQIEIVKEMIKDTPTEWYVKKEKIDNLFEALDILGDTIKIALKDSNNSELDSIYIQLYNSVVSREEFKQQIKDLAIKKIDECRRVPAQGIILFDEAKQKLGEM